jgi:hypothetical protein
MVTPHEGEVSLNNDFVTAWNRLSALGEIGLQTSVGTPFTARAAMTQKGRHIGQPVIRFSPKEELNMVGVMNVAGDITITAVELA